MQRTAPRSPMRFIGRSLGAVLLLGLLAGCMLPPQPHTEAGKDVFNLYLLVLALALIVFVGVEGFILYAVFRYRRKSGDDVLPEQLHGNTTVEIIWTAIPTVIVFVLFTFSMITLGEVEARAETPGATIEVEGFQWQWTFNYEEGAQVRGAPGQPPTMAVPVGEPVRLILKSNDVNHSFYVPEFLIKRDLIDYGGARAPNELEFTVTEEGTYAGQCAEFCGTGHADMTFAVQAMSRADYDAWVQANIAGETPKPSGGAAECGTTISIVASNSQFDIDSFEVPAGTPFCIEFENQDNIQHNVAILDSGTPLFEGEFLNEPGTITYQVPALDAGDYQFLCQAHPTTMLGDVTVTQ
ncbi:MAG TPA: cytochrome c oxidase subunit II [Candidatus Limnocylindria bacterium]|nr:cytochrome c oxidase subunit II [Candidatus Limnocylindria bacterium]